MNILIVEDEELAAKKLQKILYGCGFFCNCSRYV